MLEDDLINVHAIAEPVTIGALATAEAALRLLSLARSAVSGGVLTAADVVQWEEDLRAKDDRGVFRSYVIIFVADGRVPTERLAD